MDTAAIDQVLRDAVARGDVPNAVAVAADRGGVVYEGAAGPRAVGEDEPVGADSVFRIASMTKMVATVAALQLVERGALDLDAPVERYRPEFAELGVLAGFDGDTPRVRPPASPPTVRQLITHTAGHGYWFFNPDLDRWHKATGAPTVTSGSKEALTAPLVTDPGTRFEYGINTDWLGLVVESASAQGLDGYLKEHVFEPLGMRDTAFLIDAEQRARLVAVHRRGDDGRWGATDIDWNQRPDWWSAGHGLYSTPRDYLTFQRMLLGGGTLHGAAILRPETVNAAFTNQIGPLDFPPSIPTADPVHSCDVNLGPGLKWGYGLLLNTQAQPGMRAAGSGAWAGIFNTHFWVDRARGLTAAIYTQLLPFVEPKALQLYVDFERALYAAR